MIDLHNLAYATVKQFAEIRQTSVRTVERWVKAGLPSVKQGRGRRIKVKDANLWIDSGHLAKVKRTYTRRLTPSSQGLTLDVPGEALSSEG